MKRKRECDVPLSLFFDHEDAIVPCEDCQVEKKWIKDAKCLGGWRRAPSVGMEEGRREEKDRSLPESGVSDEAMGGKTALS